MKRLPVIRRPKRPLRAAAFVVALCVIPSLSAVAAEGGDPGYDVEIVLDDLARPTGITIEGNNVLYVSEIPDPGQFGGANTIRRFHLRSGRASLVSEGEPEPVNLAMGDDGSLYWTCRTAGVVLEADEDGDKSLFLDGLDRPTGITVGGPSGAVYLTQVPQPGVFGGANTVDRASGVTLETVSAGEPEPTDVVVADDGTLYWTCRTAGVIIREDSLGNKEILLDGLAEPTGIALSPNGKQLVFTELPTPGIPGSLGGTNRVVSYDLDSGAKNVVNSGDPEPTDVTIAPDGSIYWTCTTAGVVAKATPR